MIEKSAIVASQYGYQFIGTEHFLYGLLTVPQNKAKVILSKLGIDIHELEQNLINVFENISKFPEMPAGLEAPGSPLFEGPDQPAARCPKWPDAKKRQHAGIFYHRLNQKSQRRT